MRTISLFSCGAASAVATKLILAEEPNTLIYNTEIIEEHIDNRRFLYDCEKWYGKSIIRWRNDKYNGSIYEVFEKQNWIKGPNGATCTKHLKRSLYKNMFQPGDTMVIGFTVEEEHRLKRLIHGVGGPDGVKIRARLIEKALTKNDCLGLLANAGIEIPEMYKLGYSNNNCIGCVKGGKGYWNKIRVDFPDVFERMAAMEEKTKCSFFKETKKGGPRTTLRDLKLGEGAILKEPNISCGFFCQMAEEEMND